VHLLSQIHNLGLKVLIHLRHLIQSFVKLLSFNTFTLLDLLNYLLDKLVYFLATILLLTVKSALILRCLVNRSLHPLFVPLICLELLRHFKMVLLHLLLHIRIFVIRLIKVVGHVFHLDVRRLSSFIVIPFLLLTFQWSLTHSQFNFLIRRVLSSTWYESMVWVLQLMIYST